MEAPQQPQHEPDFFLFILSILVAFIIKSFM